MSSVNARFAKSLLVLACVSAMSMSTAMAGKEVDDVDVGNEASGTEIGPELLEALWRDLALSAADLPQYQAVEKQAAELEERGPSFFGDSYAGTWIERAADGSFYTVVASTQSTDSGFADGVEVRQVGRTLNELNDTVSMLNGSIATLYSTRSSRIDLAALHRWSVDVKRNEVVLWVAPGADKSAVEFLAASGVDPASVRIEYSEGTPSTAVARNIFGGRAYSSCSIGFAVSRGSTKGFVTAGHCGGQGSSATISGEFVGSVQGSSFPTDDYAWANVRSEDILQPFVTQYNGGTSLDLRVAGNTSAAVGASICRSGRTTGYRCGTVRAKNETVNYSGSVVFGLTNSSACLAQGDSGGGWITPGGQAQGVSSGGSLDNGSPRSNCSFASPVSWFQPVNEILSAYGLTLTR